MAIKYMDPVGGNNANDGSSFALRFKSFEGGATTARVAAGDTVRIIASPDPNSIGTGTWTDNSGTITLGAAVTQTIDNCDSAWTASANVTCSTSTDRKQGTASATAAVASGFTTGKIAYKATGTLDLSGYEQVSLWFKTSTSLAPGVLELRLCSDTTGDTAVNTVPLPVTSAQWAGTGWFVVLKDFAAALGASIQSVALYAVSDPGIVTITLDNIIACKANGAANCLTHLSLIGKNTVGEPEWYPLLSIDGTTVVLGADRNTSVSSPARPYRGTTEAVTTYARQPLVDIDSTGYDGNWVSAGGSIASPVTYSGGWNRTDMSTQTGETWISGSHHYDNDMGTPIYTSGLNDAVFRTIGVAHAPLYGAYVSGDRLDFGFLGMAGCNLPFSLDGSSTNCVIDGGSVVHNVAHFGESATIAGYGNQLIARRVEGSNIVGVQINADSLAVVTADIDKIDNSGTYGVQSTGNLILRDTVFQNNTSGSIVPNPVSGDPLTVVNGTFPSEPTVTSTRNFQIRLHDYNGTAGDHRVIGNGWKLVTDTTVRHTASGVAWKITISSTSGGRAMQHIPLAKVAVSAGTQVTMKAWVRRTNTALAIGIKVLGGQIAGVDADVSAEITAAADTWEERTITFTPSAAGVVELLGYATATATGHSGYWDDLTITQA
ncbi:hypothetical protein [Aromatoleum anaerobium]|uniref:Uncharacterized protein n=2 Tax=Aromatoleum TaxID=551759 RepID=A0ABX1PS38_9RHOO|nr:hypothetical protein [Aromatoleum anaerobium]MCK0507896.1 hypothetical protein [Aromatoleum anaerobium]